MIVCNNCFCVDYEPKSFNNCCWGENLFSIKDCKQRKAWNRMDDRMSGPDETGQEWKKEKSRIKRELLK